MARQSKSKSKSLCKPEPSDDTCQSEPIVKRMVVAGVVSIEDTGQGVPGLVVEIHHIGQSPVRLSSTVTGSAGRFSVTITEDQIKNLSLHNLHIQLLVLTAEKPGLVRADRILFESDVRENAALSELFQIEIPVDLLVKKGLQRTVDNARPLAERRAEALAEASKATRIVSEEAKKRTEVEIDKAKEHRRFFNDVVAPSVLREISTVSEREQVNPRFVADENEVFTRSAKAQHDELVKLNEEEKDSAGITVKKVRRHTRIQLEADVLRRLGMDQPTSDTKRVTQEQLEAALGLPLDKPTSIQRAAVLSDPCRSLLPGEECLNTEGDSTSGTETEGDSTSGTETEGDIVGENVAFDSGVSIAALMDPQTAPEHTVRFDDMDTQLEGKLGQDELAKAIGGLTLLPGPADVPSFHDFSSLQLAFESVWQEAIDDRILDDVESAYNRIVELGAQPADDGTWNLDGLISYGWQYWRQEVPQVVASHVRISLEEYLALSITLRGRLDTIGSLISEHREAFIIAITPDGPSEEPPSMEDSGGGGGGMFGFVKDLAKDALNAATSLATLPINLATAPQKLISDLLTERMARGPQLNTTAISLLEKIRILEAEADRIVSHSRQNIIERERGKLFRPDHEIIARLRNARSNAYPFRHFAASPSQKSVNFGLMTTYRQLWTPVSYQVGDLVKTIPLGPKESRKYSKKEVQKRKRSEKELESNLSNSKYDSESKSRAEAEILAKASGKTSFTNSATGSFSYGMEGGMSTGGESTSTFSADAERHSQNTKKNMRESVVKASEERKRETKMEVETEETFESEFTESGEIMNPNDEITCTFLFYELQRRYRINEKLHRLQSVVLVAQEMPSAREIDSVWLIQHDWILNRVLLDDSFKPALTYVSTTLVSEQETLSYMRRALIDQQALTEQIKEDLADRRSSAGLRYAALERQIERTAQDSGDSGGIWDTVSDAVSGGGLLGGILGGGDDGEDNSAKIREDAAREAWGRERKEEQSFRNRLGDAQSTLASMRDKFNDKLSTHLAEVTQVERLATHIYQNIMYYMQAIWSHEPDDQRFLRLRDVPVPDLRPHKPSRNFSLPGNLSNAITFDPDRIVGIDSEYGIGTIPPQPENIPTLPLAQIGDLSNPLGFMGNYIILPMYETNALTDFMMDPYVVFAKGEYGISDPDPAGNMSLEEFSDYVCCLKKTLSTERFEQLAPTLSDRLKQLLQSSVRENEEIIVGTGNLYIEALPGAHSIMEQFKHLHRQIDVKAAQEELRTTAIDNIRRAQRILNSELEDPDIEAKYLFEGNGSATVVAPVPGDGS
ncbi:MAG: hypothetical protein GY753_19050 [Gammaproteobacteria bacterium]|nr:hypothetical protein [Gammaproteobacteria bacterium]